MIKFNRVFKVYEKNIKALDDINIEIAKGEFVFLAGPSGAGKSTILKLLYREEIPTMGTIFIDNKEITHLNEHKMALYRRSMGFVFQDFKLLFDRTVFENIALPLVITGISEAYTKRRVAEMIEKIGLKGKEKLNPWHLSGGEKQRVAIARAVITSPPVILADEPTGNLDEESAWELMKWFLELSGKGTTIIFATHNRNIMEKYGKRIIRLKEGKVVEV
ncbi:MAG: cell division ATP-binding protein FtsE [bacterium]